MVHDADDGIVRLVLAASGMPDGELHRILRRTAARNGWTLDIGDEEALFERSDIVVATSIPIALLAAPDGAPVPPLVVVADDPSIVQNDAWSAPRIAALLDRRDLERRLPVALHAVLAGLNVTASPSKRGEPQPGSPDLHGERSNGALSPAEHAVYETLRRGLSNRAIAEELDISVNTVKFHLSSIFAKLGVHNRTQAVAAAAPRGDEGTRTGIDSRAEFV